MLTKAFGLSAKFSMTKMTTINQHTMVPEIRNCTEKKLIGKHIPMSFSNNKTHDLWKSFMPTLREVKNRIGADLYSIQIYPPEFFGNFNPDTRFEKWAAIEVTSPVALPDGMESLLLSGGLYAVFLYKGAPAEAEATFQYIHKEWLLNSQYVLDDRPHFEILGEKYKNNEPDSEEEIWIPIKIKNVQT